MNQICDTCGKRLMFMGIFGWRHFGEKETVECNQKKWQALAPQLQYGAAIADDHTENARELLRRVRSAEPKLIHATEQAKC